MFTSSSHQGIFPAESPVEKPVYPPSLKFSDDGPNIPGDLVDAILRGDAVFLCGSGVSSPPLPNFKDLVAQTCKVLGLEMSRSEGAAFKCGRFDEVMDSFRRKLTDGGDLAQAIAGQLKTPSKNGLSNHRTILSLSRYSNDRIGLITTNFDTLFEQAATKLLGENYSNDISITGPAMPAPGRSKLEGIVHLHGRIADAQLGLDQSQLVLSSSDFSNAYLRQGWASRYLFDLFRCKHVIFVGYSANDIPVRYILNVLETDRSRFSDLNRVFAFAEYNDEKQDTEESWQFLGVSALTYKIVGDKDHKNLWEDLEKLAKYVERRKESFPKRVREILKLKLKKSCHRLQEEIAWLLMEPRNLWSDALNTITDPEWFDFLLDRGLWSEGLIADVVAAWIGKDLENSVRFKYALQWQRKLGKPFTDRMDRWLWNKSGINQEWSVVWRFFSQARPGHQGEFQFNQVQEPLNGEILVDSDIRMALSHLVPKLELRRSPDELEQSTDNQNPPRLHELLDATLDVSDPNEAKKWADELCKLKKHSLRILESATNELRSLLELEKDLEFIGKDYDYSDFFVPAVECHPQNENRDDKTYLVQLMSSLLTQSQEQDRDGTLRVVHTWLNFPGRLGLRLFLNALRSKILFSADEAITALLSLPDPEFWQLLREPALLIRDRAGDAKLELLERLEQRLLESGLTHFEQYELGPNESDWRPSARDKVVWLRLKMLEDARDISNEGTAELAAITRRNSHFDRNVEERDLFLSYTSTARFIEVDPPDFSDSGGEDPLQIARKIISSPDLDVQRGWRANCDSDPEGALDMLTRVEFETRDAALWIQLLYALATPSKEEKPFYDRLRTRALEHLFPVKADALLPLARAICYVIRHNDRSQIARLDEWLLKLWRLLMQQPVEIGDSGANLFDVALNSSAGYLATILLMEIYALGKSGDSPTTNHVQVLKEITECHGNTGILGCAVLVRDIRFIFNQNLSDAIYGLRAILLSDETEGQLLRTVLLQNAGVHPGAAAEFKISILRGIEECRWDTGRSLNVALWIVVPAVAELTQDKTHEWGITSADVANVLKRGCPAIRIGALEALRSNLKWYPGKPEDAFKLVVAPFFQKVWPRELTYQVPEQTHDVVSLIVAAGEEFPDALKIMQPYLRPAEAVRDGLSIVAESDMPQRFPHETLDLLWIICGQGKASYYYRLAEIIDQLLEAVPNLKNDRRLQWLELLAERF